MGNLSDPRFLVSLTAIAIAGLFDLAVLFLPLKLDKELVTVILTALNANGFVVAVQYWLGSSSGSKDKDTAIQQLSSK